MEINKAAFSLKEFSIHKASIDLTGKGNEVNVDIEPSGVFNQNTSSFKTQLRVVLELTKSKHRVVEILAEAIYKIPESGSLEEIPEHFYANSLAIVFPYVRAYIGILTSQAGSKAIILPVLNLTSLGPKLKTNTEYGD